MSTEKKGVRVVGHQDQEREYEGATGTQTDNEGHLVVYDEDGELAMFHRGSWAYTEKF